MRGRNGSVEKTAQLTVEVERWLLVDDDRSGNNWPANDPNKPDSNADLFARAAMQGSGRTFEVRVVPYSGSGQDRDEPNSPSAQELSRYSGVIRYTGNTTVHPITDTDRAELAAFLNTAHHKLILLSPGFVRDATTNGGTLTAPGTAYQSLVTGLLGLDKVAFPGAAPFTLGGEANTVMTRVTVNVASSVRGFLQPGAGTEPLLREGTNAVATGRANIGTTSTSRAVLGAFSLGHLAQGDAVTLIRTELLNTFYGRTGERGPPSARLWLACGPRRPGAMPGRLRWCHSGRSREHPGKEKVMDEETGAHLIGVDGRVYVLRVWYEGQAPERHWRASLREGTHGERRHFASIETAPSTSTSTANSCGAGTGSCTGAPLPFPADALPLAGASSSHHPVPRRLRARLKATGEAA